MEEDFNFDGGYENKRSWRDTRRKATWNIGNFGYTLYMKMLQEEIDKIKGRFEEDIDDIEIKVNYPAFIPNEYIEKDEKIKVYRRITEVKSIIELENIKDELIDRFGKCQ